MSLKYENQLLCFNKPNSLKTNFRIKWFITAFIRLKRFIIEVTASYNIILVTKVNVTRSVTY